MMTFKKRLWPGSGFTFYCKEEKLIFFLLERAPDSILIFVVVWIKYLKRHQSKIHGEL